MFTYAQLNYAAKIDIFFLIFLIFFIHFSVILIWAMCSQTAHHQLVRGIASTA